MISCTYVSIINQSLSNMYITFLDLHVFECQPLTCMVSYLYSEKMDQVGSGLVGGVDVTEGDRARTVAPERGCAHPGGRVPHSSGNAQTAGTPSLHRSLEILPFVPSYFLWNVLK